MKNVVLYDDVERVNRQNSSIIENAYENELIEYFQAIEGSKKPRYSFEKDSQILVLIDRIEGGM